MSHEIKSHRDLVVWQKAVELGLAVYDATQRFPGDERFGLTNQLRRASVSIASNIAEGYGRGTTDDYARYLRVARGSLFEVDTQLLFAVRLGYLSETTHHQLDEALRECSRLLAGLLRSLARPA